MFFSPTDFTDFHRFGYMLCVPICVINGKYLSPTDFTDLHGFGYNSRNNADFVVKETSANDYDCAIRIVDKSSPDCDEWRITSERALAKHKVYIAPQNELGYDYKVRIIR